MSRASLFPALLSALAHGLAALPLPAAAAPAPAVVINELYYFAPEDRPAAEFVELHNPGPAPVSLAGWTLGKFEFPAPTTLSAGGFLVVAKDPAAFEREFRFKPLGPLAGRLRHSGGAWVLRDGAGRQIDRALYEPGPPWPAAAAGLGASLERVNPSLSGALPGAWRASGFPDTPAPPSIPRADRAPRPGRPTPGAVNSVFAPQPAPLLLAVEHQPAAPKPGEPVRVTVRVESGGALPVVTLSLQFVEPGAYLRRSDPAFATNWVSTPMRDDGREGDERAGDGLYTALVRGAEQRHRRLVRYRVAAALPGGLTALAPQAGDPSPNLAWFVYGGLPGWSGALTPGRTAPLTFPGAFLETLPAYHVIGARRDVEQSQWDGGANRRPFYGTFVCEGRVYDHIRFHNRGQASTYNTGKNKWGFAFNRGSGLAARDNRGRLYSNPWHSLDLNACASPWVQMNRGMAGLDEALPFRAFQLAGVPSANTHWVQLRVVDDPAESSPKDQFAGDLWGLYLAVQGMNGGWLDDLGLPDGDIFSLQTGRKHAASTPQQAERDWNQFRNGASRSQPEAWWRVHLDLDAFYSFHALNRLLANVDLREGANHGFYHPLGGRWAPVPWDLDMMFIPSSHQSGVIDAVRCLEIPALLLEYQNRAREILDLFAADPAPDGGQVGQLAAELAGVLQPAGHARSWPELDAALWNEHPQSHARGKFYVNPSEEGWSGRPFKRVLATPDFPGFCRYIVEFATDSRPVKNYQPDDNNPQGYGYGHLSHEARDPSIPQRPVLRQTGPAGRLAFEISPYASPRKDRPFGAVQWRAAEITAPGRPGFAPDKPWSYELQARWSSPPIPEARPAFELPRTAARPGRLTRVRARYQDATGRWSHWSAPVEVVPGAP